MHVSLFMQPPRPLDKDRDNKTSQRGSRINKGKQRNLISAQTFELAHDRLMMSELLTYLLENEPQFRKYDTSPVPPKTPSVDQLINPPKNAPRRPLLRLQPNTLHKPRRLPREHHSMAQSALARHFGWTHALPLPNSGPLLHHHRQRPHPRSRNERIRSPLRAGNGSTRGY